VAKFTEALAVSLNDLVYLIRAESKPSMQMAWYYVQLDSRLKLPIFLKLVKTGLNLKEFGIILYSGWGTEPPDDIKQKIKERFSN